MLHNGLHYLGFFLATFGMVLILLGSLGIVRVRGGLSKLHFVGLGECVGLPFFLVGMNMAYGMLGVKTLLTIIMIWIFAPIATSVFARLIHDSDSCDNGRSDNTNDNNNDTSVDKAL